MSFLQKPLSDGTSFGHDFRELRELRGFSREDISESTRVHVSVIAALEEERLDALNDPLYAERHIRSIVEILEARPAYYLQKYRALLESHHALRPGAMEVKPRIRRWDLFVTSRVFAVLGFLCLVGLVAAYLFWQGRILQESPYLIVSAPQEGEILKTPHVTIAGQTEGSALVSVNGRPVVVNRDGTFSSVMDIPRGTTTLTIEARRRYGPTAIETRRVVYER